MYIFYEPDTVTVWVRSEEEKQKWEQFVKLVIDEKLNSTWTYEQFSNLEFASDNANKYGYFQEIYNGVVNLVLELGLFEESEIPILVFAPLQNSGTTDGEVVAQYHIEMNMIILNNKNDTFSYLRNVYRNEDIKQVFLHELGHAWFEQKTTEEVKGTYYELVVFEQETSPYFLTVATLTAESIDKQNPNGNDKLFLWKAVDEDFAETFALYIVSV